MIYEVKCTVCGAIFEREGPVAEYSFPPNLIKLDAHEWPEGVLCPGSAEPGTGLGPKKG